MSRSGPEKARAPAMRRRDFVKLAGVGALAGAMPLRAAVAAPRTIKIGLVTPQTGPLAAFAEADEYVLPQVRSVLAGGLEIAGARHPVEIVVKDSQSNPNRAADVAAQLILDDKVDLVVTAHTPETVNPVADQCEANEKPCISGDAPWQPYFFGRGGKPDKGFEWTYHFFWGLEDLIGVYTDLWKSAPTNKAVGGLWPNDTDGNAFSDAKLGFPPVLAQMGFALVDPGRFQSFTDNFSTQIAAFKKANVEIVTGVLVPPDFNNFWAQAAQQGFAPKIVTVGKALEFPSAIAALGPRGKGMSVEIWWSPHHPYKSSLTGDSSAALAAGFTKATKKPWTMPLGFKHALFELAIDVLKRTPNIDDPKAIRDAIVATNLNTIVGPIDWHHGPVKNVAKTPLVGGQWQPASAGGLELVITSNNRALDVPIGGKLALLGA
jgi:branched-chain amino acid transport system substrate-binding protein